MPETTESKTTAVIGRLTVFLMQQAKVPVDPANAERNPQHQRFQKVAQTTVQFLGAEDYLSLVTALDHDDTATVVELVRIANRNRRTDATESVVVPLRRSRLGDRDLLIREGYSHVVPPIAAEHRDHFLDLLAILKVRHLLDADGSFIVDLREDTQARTAHRLARTARQIVAEAHTPVSRMVQNGLFTDWIGERSPEGLTEDEAEAPKHWYDVQFSRPYPHDVKVVAVQDSDPDAAAQKASRHLEDTSKYNVADYSVEIRPGQKPSGSTRVAAVLESNQESGVMRHKKPELNETVLGMAAIPPLQRMRQLAGLSGDTYDIAPYGGMDDAAEAPAPVVVANDDLDDDLEGGDLGGDDLAADGSSAFADAMAKLDGIMALVNEMKISEYQRFCERVADFADDVHDIGRKLRGE